ncbi:rho GDP-dissociation inhibitor 1 [Hibiscus syriacus]|uniref:Rho GDP-dissociation inhibitor 1 n=1 Tax=Hibiscus syriacus TaxID=106335 RepID=A0A6A3AUZ4_HIBSY|nr:rho GDP-dissociation inhibitor 1 [Hibiscus syriacus]
MIPPLESLAAEDYKASNGEKRPDTGNIEEAELSLPLMGRIEYQKGNIEAALHVFEGIDIAAITPKMKLGLTRKAERRKRHSHDYAPPMSIHAVSLLLEAIFLKAKSLQHLQRFKEAAQTCKVILDVIEFSLPEGLSENFVADRKLQETLSKAVELIPELWKLSDSSFEAILSYRSIAPSNNIEEAVLLLMILLRKVSLKRIEWDPSILDHLSFALSISALLMASRISGEKPNLAEEGINFACRALESLENGCKELEGTTNLLLGLACSTCSKSVLSDVERVTRQSEALQALESARKISSTKDPIILCNLSLENAEQRKLEAALYYVESLLIVEGGSNIKGWLLLARILSAQKRCLDGEIVVNVALDQTGKWDQGELFRTKAKLQIAQGELKSAVETYSQLLALLQLIFSNDCLQDLRYPSASFEQEIWHDLAHLYISLSQWRDSEICLSKSKAIDSYSADRIHVTGVLNERKGLLKEALGAFQAALDIDPDHVPSMISTACLLRRVSSQCNAVAKSLLMNALRVDRMNPSAWYNLGLLHKAEEGVSSVEEAVECFEIAAILEVSASVEPFR